MEFVRDLIWGDPRPEQTHQEQETRQEGQFSEMERTLPMLSYRLPGWRAFEALTSYLGKRNPFARAFDPSSDELWLFDNTAFRSPQAPNVWTAEFVAAFFRKGSGKDLGKVVADLAEKLGIAEGSQEEATIATRLQPFTDSILPARFVEIVAEGDADGRLKLGPGGRSGIVAEERALPGSLQQRNDGDVVEFRAIKQSGTNMQTQFAEPTGWLIVSGMAFPTSSCMFRLLLTWRATMRTDVDDTIKVTMTPDPLGILKTTFVDRPEPVAGMPELYAHINRTIRPTWFYLTASPYNLYTFLRDFRNAYYPLGTLILRDASWMTLGGILRSLTVRTQEYKVSRLEKIQRWFPQRRVICIGDSTQTDPETYGEMYRKHTADGEAGGSWIRAIFIRKVFDIAQLDRTDKNSDERFEKAFRDVPKDVWRTFADPNELYEAIDALDRN